MSAPTIQILTHEFYPQRGGIATVAGEVALAASDLGASVEVWAPALPPGTAELSWSFGVHRLPLRGNHDFVSLVQMGRTLVRERHRLRDATVWLAEPGPMLALLALQFFRSVRPPRLILTFHGSEILRFHRNPITRWLTRRLIRHASRISTLTIYTRELLCRHFPEAADRTCLTPGALRAGFATATPAATTSPERLVILTVGRLHPRKGQLQTLQALLALPADRRKRIAYWLVGGCRRRDGCARQLRKLAATADFPVRFLGDLSDGQLAGVYAQADIFAMTSVPHGPSVEGFGLVYLEAAAHGLPIVAHAIGGVGEAVADGVNGLLVAPDDPAALTAAFVRLVDDASLRRRLGDAGPAWARRHDWRDSARQLFDLPANPVSAP